MRSLLGNKYLWSLTLGHFTIDLYSGAMPVVLLYLTTTLHLSLEQVGLVSAVYSICSSISQPLFGYVADRFGGKWLASGGLLWMSVLQGVVGFVPDFTTLMIIAPLAGFGSAAFHPPSASSANRTSGDKKTAGMAIFLLGGNGGFAFGPLIAQLMIGGFLLGGIGAFDGIDLHRTWMISVVGIIITPILFVLSGRHQPAPAAKRTTAFSGSKFEHNRAFTLLAIIALLMVMTLRAWSQSSSSLYIPQFFTQIQGMTIAEVSRLAFVFSGVLALGSLAGGFLADRVGGRTVMASAFIVAAPVSFTLFGTTAINVYLSAALLGFLTGAAWPPTLVMAQELFPKNAGVASGLALGFVFAMGGIGNYITGFLAERIGLLMSMFLVSGLPLLAAVFTLMLPTNREIQNASRAARASMELPKETALPRPTEAGGR
jgi:FSR family fosmidomycin resistance protein-like MFS transporter